MADQNAAPAAPDAAAAAPAAQGFTIEISCLPDGTFSVSSEPLEEEAQEEQGEAGSESGQPAKSIGEALKIALQLYQAGGTTGEDDFAKGYAGAASADQPEETASMSPDASMQARG